MIDPNLAQMVLDRASFLKLVQQRRVTVEQGWLNNLASWKSIHTNQGFTGEYFNHFIPALRKQLEKSATRVKQMLFPSPAFFEVFPVLDNDGMLGTAAESWQLYFDWLLSTRIKMRQIVLQMIRTYFLYQRGIAKSGMRLYPDGLWPTVRAVDPFTFYTWPETATNLEDVTLMFENTMMPYDEYMGYARMGICEPIDERDLGKPQWSLPDTVRMSQSGLGNPTDSGTPTGVPTMADTLGMVQLTECFYKHEFQYVRGWIVWNVPRAPRVVRAELKPSIPYFMAIHRQLPGEQYTPGVASDLEPLGRILNDQFNMTLEAQVTDLFPPTIIDPSAVAREESLVYRPRAKWMMDPQGAKPLPSNHNAGAGFQGIQMTMGLVESYGGMGGPLSEGQPARGMPRAGFAVSSLINLSMSDIRYIAESFEESILTPILAELARLTMHIPPQQVMKIPGAQNIVQGPFQALNLQGGEYAFKWIGSLQKQDQQMRGQAFLSYLGTLAKLFQGMQQAGFTLDFPTIGKRGFRDIVGERGADSLVIPMNPQQQQLYLMQMMGGRPQAGGPPGGNPPANTGTPEESERQQSRQMAAGPMT